MPMNNAVPASVVDTPSNAGMDTMNQLCDRTKVLIAPLKIIVVRSCKEVFVILEAQSKLIKTNQHRTATSYHWSSCHPCILIENHKIMTNCASDNDIEQGNDEKIYVRNENDM
jgi:hypothetical protein